MDSSIGTVHLINSSLIRTNAKDIRPDDLGEEESIPAAFRAAAGWTPEDGYSGDEGPSIPAHLKGKGKALIHDPDEGGSVPEEQVSSGSGLPQPGSPVHVCVPPTS